MLTTKLKTRRTIAGKTTYVLFSLLLLLLSGCQKNSYTFAPPAASLLERPSLFLPGELPEAAVISGLEKTDKTVGSQVQKVRTRKQFRIPVSPARPGTESEATVTLLPVKFITGTESPTFIQKSISQRLQTSGKIRKADFPVAWFVILSFVIAGLIVRIISLGPDGPPAPNALIEYLFLIPLAIIWLVIALKGVAVWLAPLLGWSVFWTAVLILPALYVLSWVVAFIVGPIVIKIRKIKEKRFQQELKKKQLEQQQAP